MDSAVNAHARNAMRHAILSQSDDFGVNSGELLLLGHFGEHSGGGSSAELLHFFRGPRLERRFFLRRDLWIEGSEVRVAGLRRRFHRQGISFAERTHKPDS